MKMKEFVLVSSLVILLSSHLAQSRSIASDRSLVSDGGGGGGSSSFLQWRLSATETCEPEYGFLPCSSNVWGLLFLIVVYEVLLSIGGQYVTTGSNLFLQIIGPGVVGGSVFQLLGTVPQLVLMLLPSLTNSTAQAQERATTGMAMVLGGVALRLTLIWGLTIIFGSYDPSGDAATATDTDTSVPEPVKTITATATDTSVSSTGSAVVTDIETSWTARLILVAAVPFLVLELQNAFTSSSVKRVIILIALIITVLLLIGYILYQTFQPWIQNRCFEYMVDQYAKDKLLGLITKNGKPDIRKMRALFNKVDKDNNASITAGEVRVLIVGVKIDDDDTSTKLQLDNITTYFDTDGDGGINQDEFINGMTKLASTLLGQTSTTPATNGGTNLPQITSQDQQPLLASSTITSTSPTDTNSWTIYLRATFFVVFGTFIASALAEPLIKSIIDFADVANISSFSVSYLALPLALNYNTIIQSVTSALQQTQKSNSLTLSSLYSGVFMGNIVGLMPFLAPVYFRNLTSDVSAELLLVLIICIAMGAYTSLTTTFPRWTGYVALGLYPISLATVYVLTTVLGWS